VTCNYERLAERNQKHRVQTDRWAVWGDSQWTAINLPHACLVSRRLHGGSARYDVTHLTNSQDRHQGRTNTARQVSRATEYCTAAPTICGSWVRNLVHVTHLAHGILSWLQHLRKICASWCSLLPKGLLH
jgi:hypothetical protein